MGDKVIQTPASKLVVKWLDFGSAHLTACMGGIEARRASAQRAWFNAYLRKQHGVYSFIVPTGVHDWVNVLVTLRKLTN